MTDFWLAIAALRNAKQLKKIVILKTDAIFCRPEDEKKEIKPIFTE